MKLFKYSLLLMSLCIVGNAQATKKHSKSDVYNSSSDIYSTNQRMNSLPSHDLNDVYDQGGIRQGEHQLVLQPGLYELGGLHSSKRTNYYMFVEQDINSPEETYKVMIFSKKLHRNKVGKAWIMNAKPFGNGSSLMLANLKLENNRFINQDEDIFFDLKVVDNQKQGFTRNDETKYIIIDKNLGEGKPFLISGTHPALSAIGDGNLGMRRTKKKNPRLLSPQYGFFKYNNRGRAPKNPDSYLANGDKVLLGHSNFRVVSINGAHGGFYALEEIKINTLSRQYASTGLISTAVAYVEGCWSDDGFIKLVPQLDGSYSAYYFDESHLDNIFERFFNWLFGRG